MQLCELHNDVSLSDVGDVRLCDNDTEVFLANRFLRKLIWKRSNSSQQGIENFPSKDIWKTDMVPASGFLYLD